MTKLHIAIRESTRAYNAFLRLDDKYNRAERKFKAKCRWYKPWLKSHKAWCEAVDKVDQIERSLG